MTKTYNASDIYSVEMGFSVKDLIGMEHSPFDGNQGLENTPPSASATGAQQSKPMTPNTYHEEIPDQDVVNQLERMERKAMTITPEKLREKADLVERGVPLWSDHAAETLRSAADEIERLRATIDKQVTEITQLKLAAMGWKQ